MKKVFGCILWLGLLLLPSSVFGEEGGKVILDLEPEKAEAEINVESVLDRYFLELDQLDRRYPGDLIEEDFSDDVAVNNPDLDEDKLSWRQNLLRNGIRIRRIYRKAAEKVKEFIIEQDLPIHVEESEFESGAPVAYQESDSLLVIPDFKKIIAYSPAEKDVAATAEFKAREAGTASPFEQRQLIKKALLEGDWKTVFSYGLFDGKPIEKPAGIGEWDKDAAIHMRLISAEAALGDRKIINAALQIGIENGYLLLIKDYQNYQGMRTDFGASENLKRAAVNWPLPRRFPIGKEGSIQAYTGSFIIPVELEVSDINKDLIWRTDFEAELCGYNKCRRIRLSPELRLHPGEAAESAIAPFMRQARNHAPKSQSNVLTLKSLTVEESQVLRLDIESSESVNALDIFLESSEGIKFANPLVRMDGSQITARFKPINYHGPLAGKQFTASVRVRPEVSVRQTMTAERVSLLDAETEKLSLTMIWFGFIGGFLLNLMPCVFPVLSLKLLSFSRFGGVESKRIRRGFLLNLLGIWASFVIIIVGLITLKLLGKAAGWGMQFQNVYFLSLIIFAVTAFLAHVWGLFSFRTPQFVGKLLRQQEGKDKLLHFLTGVFLVLLSTPCTAPYLGTALGFALAGGISDIIVIVSAVGLGLSLPYLLLAVFPILAEVMPPPGPWMSRLASIMAVMLLLTLLWLLSILGAQTSGALVFHFILFLSGFLLILWFRKQVIELLDRRPEEADLLLKTRHLFEALFAALLALLIAGAMIDAGRVYRIKRGEIEASSEIELPQSEVIRAELKQGHLVLVRVGADWCLTCKFNDLTVFDSVAVREFMEENRVIEINVDWTNYNPDVLAFMEKYGRRGLPFYILFAPRIPEGMVLPEIMSERAFREMVENLRY